MALTRLLRLRDRRRIQAVGKRGFRRRGILGQAAFLPAPRPRILFIISKAVSKKATERNRIRRILQEWANTREKEKIFAPYEMLVWVGKDANGKSGTFLQDGARELLLGK